MIGIPSELLQNLKYLSGIEPAIIEVTFLVINGVSYKGHSVYAVSFESNDICWAKY